MAKAVRDEVLTTAETCRYLKVAPRTLYRYIQEKRVVFLKRAEPTSLRAYTLSEWNNVLKQTRSKLDEDQSRLFMHHVVSETATSEIDKTGRILIPGKLRKHINLADDQEIVLIGMYEHFEIWEPADWRRYLAQTENRHEDSMSKIMDLL